jgi:hypothetical protein
VSSPSSSQERSWNVTEHGVEPLQNAAFAVLFLMLLCPGVWGRYIGLHITVIHFRRHLQSKTTPHVEVTPLHLSAGLFVT